MERINLKGVITLFSLKTCNSIPITYISRKSLIDSSFKLSRILSKLWSIIVKIFSKLFYCSYGGVNKAILWRREKVSSLRQFDLGNSMIFWSKYTLWFSIFFSSFFWRVEKSDLDKFSWHFSSKSKTKSICSFCRF